MVYGLASKVLSLRNLVRVQVDPSGCYRQKEIFFWRKARIGSNPII